MNLKFIAYALTVAGVVAAAPTCAAANADPALIHARQKFFGIENVDEKGNVKKDKVIFSWATNTTYVVSVQGRVMMLDSYLLHAELPTAGPIDRRRTKALPQDFVDLRPEAIFLGHGHGDHADNAAFVAKWTGATIYASPETCDVMQQDVIRMWNDPNAHNGGDKIIPNGDPVKCEGVVPRNSPPGEYTGTLANPTGGTTTVRRVMQFDPQICILAFKHIHSGNAPADPSFTHAPLNDLADPRDAGRVFDSPAVTYPALYPTGIPYTPPGNPALRVPGQINTTTTGFGGAAGIIEIAYHFVVRGNKNFTFTYVNSAGPVKEGIGSGSPGLISVAQYNDPVNNGPAIALAAEIGKGLFSIMENVPDTDVLLGSVISLGSTANQQRDIISYIQRLKPRVFIPGHFSAVAQRGSSPYYLVNWRETAQAMGFPQSEWPELRWMVDPLDYFRPLVYDPDDERWAKSHDAARKFRAHCN